MGEETQMCDVAVFDGSKDPQPGCHGECNPTMSEDPSPASQASGSSQQEKQGQLWLFQLGHQNAYDITTLVVTLGEENFVCSECLNQK